MVPADEARLESEKNQVAFFETILANLEDVPEVLLPDKQQRIAMYEKRRQERLRLIAALERKIAIRKNSPVPPAVSSVAPTSGMRRSENKDILPADEEVSPDTIRGEALERCHQVYNDDGIAG